MRFFLLLPNIVVLMLMSQQIQVFYFFCFSCFVIDNILIILS
jgi:hypothetical protein